MHVITVEFVVKDGHEDDFHAAMRRQADNSLALEPGCHRFDVCVDPADRRRIFLYEIYANATAFAAHLASAHYQDFDASVSPWVESKSVAAWRLTGG